MLISDIGSTDNTALLCHTNSANSGGNWHTPNGYRVSNANVPGFTRNRDPMVVRLKKRTGTGTPPQGIYQCSIQDAESTPQTLYVGLYNSGGGNVIFMFLALPNCFFPSIYSGHLTLSGNMTFTSKTDNSFTLTCISTGGPPTTVSWTRDSTTVITEGTETVLNDGVMAKFTHTLLVTDRRAGLYRCAIANEVSSVSAELTVQGETFNYT